MTFFSDSGQYRVSEIRIIIQGFPRARGSRRFAWHPKALVSSSMGREGTPRPLRRKKIISFRELLSQPRLPARIALTPGPRQSGSHSQSDWSLIVKCLSYLCHLFLRHDNRGTLPATPEKELRKNALWDLDLGSTPAIHHLF